MWLRHRMFPNKCFDPIKCFPNISVSIPNYFFLLYILYLSLSVALLDQFLKKEVKDEDWLNLNEDWEELHRPKKITKNAASMKYFQNMVYSEHAKIYNFFLIYSTLHPRSSRENGHYNLTHYD